MSVQTHSNKFIHECKWTSVTDVRNLLQAFQRHSVDKNRTWDKIKVTLTSNQFPWHEVDACAGFEEIPSKRSYHIVFTRMTWTCDVWFRKVIVKIINIHITQIQSQCVYFKSYLRVSPFPPLPYISIQSQFWKGPKATVFNKFEPS